MMSRIFIVVEHRQGVIRDGTLELVSLARALGSGNGAEVTAVVLGHRVEALAETLSRYVPRVLLVDAEALADFRYETHGAALRDLLAEERPSLALAPHTAFGMELFPRLAVERGLPCATDCLDVEVDGSGVAVVRSVYSGKIRVRARLAPAASHLVTVRSGSYPAAEPTGEQGVVEVRPAPSFAEPFRTAFLGYREAEATAVDLTQAPLIIAVGRGIKDEENLPRVQELADALGGVVACSRPVVDKKWMEKDRQVGTSGRTVKPKAYLALGISGAFQHMAGIKGPGVVIAVNRDAKAPIFGIADYGVVEDMFKIIDALKAEAGA